MYLVKGSVQQKLRPRLLYITRKLFSGRGVAENKVLTFLKGQFTIYIKPLQRTLHSPGKQTAFFFKKVNMSTNKAELYADSKSENEI